MVSGFVRLIGFYGWYRVISVEAKSTQERTESTGEGVTEIGAEASTR
jgi:hypothetical protein